MLYCKTKRNNLWIMGKDGGTEKICLDTSLHPYPGKFIKNTTFFFNSASNQLIAWSDLYLALSCFLEWPGMLSVKNSI